MIAAQPLCSLAAGTVGLLLCLSLRRPLRHTCGARVAAWLWWLPALMAAAPWLPMPSLLELPGMSVMPVQTLLDAMPADLPRLPMVPSWQWLWAMGTSLMLVRLSWRYWRLRRSSQPLSAAMRDQLGSTLAGFDIADVRTHRAGPALLWAPRQLLLLPADFCARFEPAQRIQVLRHELAHRRRGDPHWLLLAELAAALCWFHPLLWWAMPRFRLDLELACDEHVLARHPADRTAYAQTLLYSVSAARQSVLMPWLAEPQLKERLIMIRRRSHGISRRLAGGLGLIALASAGVLASQAYAGTPASVAASQDLSFNAALAPKYPAAALKAKQQGVVVLDIFVDAQGQARQVKTNPRSQASPALVEAAIAAARQWRFTPALRQGHPVSGWARVPISFQLDEPSKK